MNNEYHIREVSKIFGTGEVDTSLILNSIKKDIVKQIKNKQPITKIFLAKLITYNVKKRKSVEVLTLKQELLKNFKHKSLVLNIDKFLELRDKSYNASNVSQYFKEKLKCTLSRQYVARIYNFIDSLTAPDSIFYGFDK